MIISDEMLMAYADGEVSADVATLILARLAVEPELLERLEQHRRLRDHLIAAYAPVMHEPVPARLMTLLAQHQSSFRGFDAVKPLMNAWPVWAMAAAAVIGVGISETGRSWFEPLSRGRDGGLQASGKLATALEHDLSTSGSGNGPRILASFADDKGRYCRVFQGSPGNQSQGVACKSGRRWQVLALDAGTAPAQPGTTLRQAASALAPSVAAAVDELRAGEPFSREQERTAQANRWTR